VCEKCFRIKGISILLVFFLILLLLLYLLYYLLCLCLRIGLTQKRKKKTLVPSGGATKATAKQIERDILMSHLSNQSKALKLKQQILENEKEQKERDRIYDTMKKRMELEKLGVSKERLDKYFRLTPLTKEDKEADSDSSISSSNSLD
jgi:hypothetical protein